MNKQHLAVAGRRLLQEVAATRSGGKWSHKQQLGGCSSNGNDHCLSTGLFHGLACNSRLARQLLNVGDVIPWVAVQRLLEAQLVKVVANEANRAAQHEQPVEAPE